MTHLIYGVALAAMSLAAVVTAPAFGETAAHQHGVGHLNILVEAGAAHLELLAPGADIVGFEHHPTTADDRAAILAARRTLADGAALFVFPSDAGCVLASTDIDGPDVEDHDGHKDDHGHKAGHKDEDHDGDKDDHGHKAGHKEDHDDEAEHSSFRVVYSFSCPNAAAPASMVVRYFERFPSSKRLRVQAIGPKGQSATTLTPDAVELAF